jgi:predicted phage tail component-like protein
VADTFLFDGTDLGAWLEGVAIERSVMPEVRLDTMDVPGRDGTVLNGRRLRPLEVNVTATLVGNTAAEVAEARHALAAVLNTGDTRRLVLPDEPDLFYNAILSGASSLSRAYERPRASLTFTVPEACAWGSQVRTASLSYGTNYVTVGGNAETWPTYSLTTESTWCSISNASGDESYSVQPVESGKELTVDMGAETTTYDGAEAYPLIGTDYFPIGPGTVRLLVMWAHGTVSWRERWV